jgi:hypothetical protein
MFSIRSLVSAMGETLTWIGINVPNNRDREAVHGRYSVSVPGKDLGGSGGATELDIGVFTIGIRSTLVFSSLVHPPSPPDPLEGVNDPPLESPYNL